MRLIIAAVGRLKDGPERELLERYRDRFADLGKRLGLAPVVWHELAESRAATATKRCAEEGAALLKLARDADAIIALDERGKALTSRRSRSCWARFATTAPARWPSSSAAPTGWRRPCARRPTSGSPSGP